MWLSLRNARPDRILTGQQVVLRPLLPQDAMAWVELRRLSRQFLQPWEPTWPQDGATAAAYHFRRRQAREEWRAQTGYSFLIFGRGAAEGRLLGGITLSNVRRGVARSGSLGYWIGAPHARQGYMTDAVDSILDYAFGRLELHRVEAACLPDNAASRRLLLKCGFQEEGRARGYLKIDGRWCDHITFAILRDDPRQSRDREG